MARERQRWGSKLGIILAVAGSAIGLGNFLRFPVQAAQNGGGAFLIPYFVSLLLLGLPLMWIEWTAGRFGGGFEHSTAPGIFHSLWRKNRFIKYFGVIGIFGPLVILIYYTYVESWCLAYSAFSLAGKLKSCATQEAMVDFLRSFQGLQKTPHFNGLWAAYLFFLVTFALNFFTVYFGIRAGIERICKIALPLLFVMGLLLMLRVLTLGAPDPGEPSWSVGNGFGFLWNPDFNALKSARVWLAAAGQIFFTLSVGIGVILTYASYLKKSDDVALSGLSAAATNEFAEVIIGGSIIIPAAYAFFGPAGTAAVAKGGAFNLGFVAMPTILRHVPLGDVFGFFWFLMLFLAGITSSISLIQPAVAFLEDEFDLSRREAVVVLSLVTFVLCHLAIFGLASGVLDELDFWGGTFCLVLFGTIETIVFGWAFGIDRAWDELHRGAAIRIPRFYRFIIKYVTPLFLLAILGAYLVQDGIPLLLLRNVKPENTAAIILTRIVLVLIFSLLFLMVWLAWRRRAANRNALPPRH